MNPLLTTDEWQRMEPWMNSCGHKEECLEVGILIP